MGRSKYRYPEYAICQKKGCRRIIFDRPICDKCGTAHHLTKKEYEKKKKEYDEWRKKWERGDSESEESKSTEEMVNDDTVVSENIIKKD